MAQPWSRPPDVTITVSGPDRDLVADIILDYTISLEAGARDRRRGSPGALRCEKLAAGMRKLAREIQG